MQKYRYCFTSESALNQPSSHFSFSADGLKASIDFLDSDLYRVALYPDDKRLLPTYNIGPGAMLPGKEGKNRLSVEGFPLFTPSVSEQDSIADSFDNMGNNKKICFNLGDYNLILYLPTFFIELYTMDGRLLMSDRPYSPYNYKGELGEGVAHFIKAERYEEIFGLGEKTGNVNKFGRSFTIGARDSMGYDASSTDPLYKHLPYYICRNSVGTFGIFYDTHAKGCLNFMEEMDNYYGHFKSFTAEDDALVYYVFLGDIKSISSKFAWLVGQSCFSPKWSLDYCGSTMAYTDAPDANDQLISFLNKCQANNYKVSGFYLSSGYTSIGDKRYVFNWNTDKIPDPKKLIKTFNDASVHFIPNIKPAFLEDHPLYNEIAQKGYFLHYKDGSPAKMPFWDGYGSYLDFTNPDAFNWWTSMVKRSLIDYGIDALWNDNNEFYIADRDVYAHGFGHEIPAYRICQVFTTLMVMASNEALPKDGERHFMSTRSGCAGVNRYAQTWTGDNYTSFKDLLFNHKMAMGMSISAMPLLGHDLGGFSGDKPDRELFMRWLQYGTLLPRFTIHSWNDDGSATEPWMYEDMIPHIQKLFAFRNRIKPYLYHLLHEVHENYDSFLTPLFVDFEDANPESDAFLLGHDVLAAPVFYEGINTVDVTLPGKELEGWYLDGTSRFFEPGQHRFLNDISDLPVLLHKAGSVFIEDKAKYSTDKSLNEDILFTVYAKESGIYSRKLYTDDGYIKITVECKPDCVEVLAPNDAKVTLVDYKNRKLVLLEA